MRNKLTAVILFVVALMGSQQSVAGDQYYVSFRYLSHDGENILSWNIVSLEKSPYSHEGILNLNKLLKAERNASEVALLNVMPLSAGDVDSEHQDMPTNIHKGGEFRI